MKNDITFHPSSDKDAVDQITSVINGRAKVTASAVRVFFPDPSKADLVMEPADAESNAIITVRGEFVGYNLAGGGVGAKTISRNLTWLQLDDVASEARGVRFEGRTSYSLSALGDFEVEGDMFVYGLTGGVNGTLARLIELKGSLSFGSDNKLTTGAKDNIQVLLKGIEKSTDPQYQRKALRNVADYFRGWAETALKHPVPIPGNGTVVIRVPIGIPKWIVAQLLGTVGMVIATTFGVKVKAERMDTTNSPLETFVVNQNMFKFAELFAGPEGSRQWMSAVMGEFQ